MRGGTGRTGLTAMAAILGAGCGPAPYTLGPEDPAAMREPPGPAAVIVIPQAAPIPEAVAERRAPRPAPHEEDGWVPDLLPRFNPFAEARTWVGAYDCPQGRTSLTLRVVDVRGTKVRAIFDFHHAPTDAAGQFLLAGEFDEHTGDMVFTPGAWIIHPDSYVTVPMAGRVSRDGTRFAGVIPAAGCGGFRLRAVR